MLAMIGIGFTIGNYLGSKLGDRSSDGSLIIIFTALIAIMIVFPYLAQSQIGAAIGLLLWGTTTFGLVPPVQMRVMQVATDTPGLASSVNIGAFNLGNAAVSITGVALALAGLLLVLLGRAKPQVSSQKSLVSP